MLLSIVALCQYKKEIFFNYLKNRNPKIKKREVDKIEGNIIFTLEGSSS